MRLVHVLSVYCLAVLCLTCGVPSMIAETYSSRWEWRLAEANSLYEEGNWLRAVHAYRAVRALRADLPQDDEICYRIARCSELGRSCLDSLLPSGLGCELVYGGKAMRWLWDTYGYYVEESEGDACWEYDKRALRELLRLHPDSSYADEAEYVLTKYSFMVEPGMQSWRAQTYVPVVKRYERLLDRYPGTNLRETIVAELAFLRDPTGEHPEWIRRYWHSSGVRYP